MLQLYGNPKSRAMRCLWMLEEIGEPYQLIEKSTRPEDLQSADYADSHARGSRRCVMGTLPASGLRSSLAR